MTHFWFLLMTFLFSIVITNQASAQLKSEGERIKIINAISEEIKRANLDAQNSNGVSKPPLPKKQDSSTAPQTGGATNPLPKKTLSAVATPVPNDSPARINLKPEDMPEELHFPYEPLKPTKKK